jgi:hypothetical protein
MFLKTVSAIAAVSWAATRRSDAGEGGRGSTNQLHSRKSKPCRIN